MPRPENDGGLFPLHRFDHRLGVDDGPAMVLRNNLHLAGIDGSDELIQIYSNRPYLPGGCSEGIEVVSDQIRSPPQTLMNEFPDHLGALVMGMLAGKLKQGQMVRRRNSGADFLTSHVYTHRGTFGLEVLLQDTHRVGHDAAALRPERTSSPPPFIFRPPVSTSMHCFSMLVSRHAPPSMSVGTLVFVHGEWGFSVAK